jgi:subtilase family serine protease
MGLYIDGATQPLVTEEIASLNAGSSYSGTFSGHAVQISGGIDQVKVCADSESVVVESFENNNCMESVIEQTTFTLRLQPLRGVLSR